MRAKIPTPVRPGERLATRELLAAAYLGAGKRTPLRMLVHVVVLSRTTGWAYRLLCDRVAFDALADGYAAPPLQTPTCPVCLRRARLV